MKLPVRSLTLITTALGALLTLPAVAPAIAPTATYLLPSASAFDGQAGLPPATAKTVTLPLVPGLTPSGKVTWYVVTESSDAADARRRGVNYAPKLARALGTSAVQTVRVRNPEAELPKQVIQFAGTVDFSPAQQVVPGAAPDFFPPSRFAPGSVADASYSPLITTGDGIVLDAPQVANASGLHDTVVSADFAHRRVTVGLFEGFYEDHPVLYTRFSGSDPLLAAIESTTFTPNLNAAPGLASDDPVSSSREAIVPIVNGPTGAANPQRQGLNSALAGEGAPLNVIQEEPADPADPSSLRYSPVWDVTPGTWTAAALNAGQRARLTSIQPTSTQAAPSIIEQAQSGALVSPPFATGPFNPSVGLNAAGLVSLCPVVAVLPISG
ncbi:hypothetical protein NBH00_22050 [Paraconexibacter antarcticus]|uniref:Spondin domain-containing protein n=1 Tax=Paraconexibacter antarcticus TaxID=2949664 RepID=A0ABY5DQX1_9ACTN|nr:hypothetical protein [Paraconexibacter antarcticus]UTI64009.1 hypothetical protein NBH00_22050 [Paraconexibacter antarcticus]